MISTADQIYFDKCYDQGLIKVISIDISFHYIQAWIFPVLTMSAAAVQKAESNRPTETRMVVDTCSNVRLVRSGLEFFELLEDMIHQAKAVIHIQVYIFTEDETGVRIANALMLAARRNVKVFVVADGYASQGLSDKFLKNLHHAGVRFRYFDPVLKSKYFYFGRRLHHKVIVIDDKALVGGINISNNYNDTLRNGAWLDWALYVEGHSVGLLRSVCEARAKDYTGTASVLSNEVAREGLCPVKVNVNDWVRGRREITRSYQEMLSGARSKVIIMSSYFIPGKILRRHLKAAAERGVQVSIIVAGKSDIYLAKGAERFMYRWMLESKIRVYEYLPRILHAKIATCDDRWLTVGSYNINNISAYASIELNVEVQNPAFVANATKRLEHILHSDCRQVNIEELKKATLFSRFLYRSAYDIFRLVLFLFTFYFKEHKQG